MDGGDGSRRLCRPSRRVVAHLNFRLRCGQYLRLGRWQAETRRRRCRRKLFSAREATGVIMVMTPTPMKTEFPDAGHVFKAEHLSLHLSLQVTRGQFSDMLRMLEEKRLKDLHFTVEDGANGSWPVFSWGMSAALA